MTHIDSSNGVVLVRAADAEVIGSPPQTGRLLADSSATGGKLSTQRVTLADGADGASPHHHAGSAELFYVLGGSVPASADRAVGQPEHHNLPDAQHPERGPLEGAVRLADDL